MENCVIKECCFTFSGLGVQTWQSWVIKHFEELQFISVTVDRLGAIIQFNSRSVTGKGFHCPQEGVNSP